MTKLDKPSTTSSCTKQLEDMVALRERKEDSASSSAAASGSGGGGSSGSIQVHREDTGEGSNRNRFDLTGHDGVPLVSGGCQRLGSSSCSDHTVLREDRCQKPTPSGLTRWGWRALTKTYLFDIKWMELPLCRFTGKVKLSGRASLRSCWPYDERAEWRLQDDVLRRLKAGVDVEYVKTVLWELGPEKKPSTVGSVWNVDLLGV